MRQFKVRVTVTRPVLDDTQRFPSCMNLWIDARQGWGA